MKSTSICILLLLSFSLFSQQPWNLKDESQIQKRHDLEREVVPDAYSTFHLDIKMLKSLLSEAPMEDVYNTRKQGVNVSLPMPDGSTKEYNFVESPCMSPVLSAKYPSIKSYRGTSPEDGSVTRIDISNLGFRGAIESHEGLIYVDPYYTEADGHYVTYYVADHHVDADAYSATCGVTSFDEDHFVQRGLKKKVKTAPSKHLGEPVIKTTYRFALACTGMWGSQQGGTVDAVLPKMNSAVNRLNGLLEDELAIKFELIDDNDKLIFFFDTEPYTEPDAGGVTLRENTEVINRAIGEGAYDVGHVITVSCTDGVAGIAFGGSICSVNKAAGVSCVGNRPLLNFMVNTTAHEIGHQFSAGHTWAACSTDLNDQFASQSSCELGSGVTILSYNGSCGTNNISGPRQSIYHSCTLEQMQSYVLNGRGAGCSDQVETDNHHPDVWIEQQGGFTIPILSPFELAGDASDMDGDNLVYSWEQVDTKSIPAGVGDPSGPLFRYVAPSNNKERMFPGLSYVLSQNDWREERWPTTTREFNFRFVARDDNPTAGGVSWADITFNSSDSAGPFIVTTPSEFTESEPGKTMLIEWDVANTDNDIIDCQYVDIYLSENNGETFPHLLKARTPNDGSEIVNIPNITTGSGIIKVKGNNTIFFNVGRGLVQVNEPSAPTFFVDAPVKTFDVCLPDVVNAEITAESLLGFGEEVTLEVISGLPTNATHSFSQNPVPPGATTMLNVDLSQVRDEGVYNVVVQASAPGVDTAELHLSILAASSFLDGFGLTFPENGVRGVSTFPEFEWNGTDNADGYRIELATNPSFSNESMIFSREAGIETSATGLINLTNSTLYYWRVVAYNSCLGEVSSEVYTFGSIALSCAANAAIDIPSIIPSTGTPDIESKILIESPGNVTDVNISVLKGNHKEIKSLRATLTSPSGTSCILFQGVCLNVETIDAGFDDESSFPNGCPNSNGRRIRPRENLSIFNGESIEGDWILKIEDTEPGNGGQLNEFQLELCSDSALDNPFIVNNNVLEVLTGSARFISADELLCADDNNTEEELLYTLVVPPTIGTLTMDGTTLAIGDQFTQEELSSGKLRYDHNGSQDATDQFVFTLIDGEGGWIDQTPFTINMTEDGASNTNDIEESDSFFSIYPNPTNDILFIDPVVSNNDNWNYTISSIDGRRILEGTLTGKTTLDLGNQSAGIYLLNLSNGVQKLYKKVLILD